MGTPLHSILNIKRKSNSNPEMFAFLFSLMSWLCLNKVDENVLLLLSGYQGDKSSYLNLGVVRGGQLLFVDWFLCFGDRNLPVFRVTLLIELLNEITLQVR